MEEKMRLQKYMSQLGLCSRRRAEELIQEGKVKVNGEIITQMGHMVNGDEKIEIASLLVGMKIVMHFVLDYME